MSKKEENITLVLSQDEALVLFELLSRFSDGKDLHIKDQAEERVLWDLCCLLEKQLVQPFREEYAVLIEKARASMCNPDER